MLSTFFSFPSQSPVHTVLIDGDQRFQRESHCELARVFYPRFSISEPKVDKYDPGASSLKH